MRNICCFAGHNDIYINNKTDKKIREKIVDLICNYHVEEFWVGNYGTFDRYSARVIREFKKTYPYIRLSLVVPYITQTLKQYIKEYEKYYDNIIIAEIPSHTPKRYGILKCNRYIVDNSHYIICYVEHGWGGAAQTLEYAQKKNHIQIFNFGRM